MSEDFDIREVLALLSPAAIKFSNIPGTSLVKLTAHDVASRLRLCSRAAGLLARGKYANDELSYRAYYFAFAVQVAGLPLALKLSKKYPKALTKLINVTFQEFVEPTCCPWCRGGPSFTITPEGIVACSACKGTGKILWRDRKRAELMQVPETTFRRWYAPLHVQMCDIIAGHEAEIVSALYERHTQEAQRRAAQEESDEAARQRNNASYRSTDDEPPPGAA